MTARRLTVFVSGMIAVVLADRSLADESAAPLTEVAVRYGMALTPVDREQVFEFADPPTVKKLGRDRYEISFASKAACDATVVIEDQAGRIVRHLASGVLGPNAPEPFQPNSLAQKLIWNGKDNLDEYVRDPADHAVRVSLGLKPTFDKLIGWHPKDTTSGRQIVALGADEEGVYTFEPFDRKKIKLFNHDAEYVRTVIPVPADSIGKPEQQMPLKTLEDGRVAPILCGLNAQRPWADLGHDAVFYQLAVAKGWIIAVTRGSPLTCKKLLRFRTDGTTGGLNPVGKQVAFALDQINGHLELCLSRDGQWIYVSGLPSGEVKDNTGTNYRHCVMRFAFDDTTILSPRDESFAGEIGRNMVKGSNVPAEQRTKGTAGSDDQHFNEPKGVATDAAGNVYVCDYGNNRIQVFSPDAKLLKSLPFQFPRQITVSPRTGEIYVLSFRSSSFTNVNRTSTEEVLPAKMDDNGFTVTKIKGPDFAEPRRVVEPQVLWNKRFDENIPKSGSVIPYWPVFTVDFWSAPVRVWVVRQRGRVQVWDESAGGLDLFSDFIEEVAKSGFRPQMIGHHKMNRIAADPLRDLLYVSRGGSWMRVDPEEGRKWETVNLSAALPYEEAGVNDVKCGRDGLVYARPRTYLLRYDPAKFVRGRGEHDWLATPESEVPFDYGESAGRSNLAPGEPGLRLSGVLRIPAQAGANGYDMGLDVSAKGTVVALVKNIQSEEARGYYGLRGPGCYMPPLESDRFRPKIYLGRPWYYQELVWVWDRKGQLLSDDLIAGLPMPTQGVRMDLGGNVYVGVGRHLNVNGKAHYGGTVAKFTSAGGRLYCENAAPAGLKRLPDAPADFFIENPQGMDRAWAVGMQWAYPGLDQVHFTAGHNPTDPYPCLCANCRFDTDPFGRCFIPKAYQYTVGVVDANGNRICEVGRYGNADSGRGPDSPVKLKDSDVALAGCSDVTVTDRYLYLNDDGNARVVRVRLDYHCQQRLAVPRQ